MNAVYFAALALAAAASGNTYTFTVQGGGDGINGKAVVLDGGNQNLQAGDGQAVTWTDNGEYNGWNGNQGLTNAYQFLHVGANGDSASVFSVAQDGTFSYQGSSRFFVCTGAANDIAFYSGEGDVNETFKTQCPGYTEVKIQASSNGAAASSAAPASSEAPATSAAPASTEAASSAAATSEAPATTAAPTTAAGQTSVVEETVVETVCTHETCTGVAPANGGVRNAAFGAAAIAAALL